eukprot:5796713-Alexandrium_andersonii.AAC.1
MSARLEWCRGLLGATAGCAGRPGFAAEARPWARCVEELGQVASWIDGLAVLAAAEAFERRIFLLLVHAGGAWRPGALAFPRAAAAASRGSRASFLPRPMPTCRSWGRPPAWGSRPLARGGCPAWAAQAVASRAPPYAGQPLLPVSWPDVVAVAPLSPPLGLGRRAPGTPHAGATAMTLGGAAETELVFTASAAYVNAPTQSLAHVDHVATSGPPAAASGQFEGRARRHHGGRCRGSIASAADEGRFGCSGHASAGAALGAGGLA